MQLEILNYEKLIQGDTAEILRLVQTASTSGIWFLDVRGPSSRDALANMKPIIDAQQQFFGRELDSKLSYSDEAEGRGYDNFEEVGVQRIKVITPLASNPPRSRIFTTCSRNRL